MINKHNTYGMENNYKKNILFIAPCFHGYEKQIMQKLKEKGYNVFFFPERDYSIIYKLVNHTSKKLLQRKQNKHYLNILKQTKGVSFDYLFVIRGYRISANFLERFKEQNPNAKMIMYQWDSNKRNPYSNIVKYFNNVYSFDYNDCRDLSLKYLPLFYTDDIIDTSYKNNLKTDFLFLGSYLPERYEALEKFIKYMSKTDYEFKYFLYINPAALIKEYIKGNFINLSYISIKPMKRAEYLFLLNSTKIVIDVSSNEQSGLAMRVIEAITLKKKIITSNKNILEEPFYNPNNICIYDVNKPNIPGSFLETPFENNYKTLSISEWLNVLIN